MGNERSIGKGFAVLSMASMLVKVMSLLFVPLMLNILGEEGYGVYSITYQIFSFIYIIANSGVPVAISKHVSELSEKRYHRAALRSFKIARSFLIAIGLVLSALMAALCAVLANAMHTPKAWMGILVLAPCVLLTAVLSAYRGYFQGRQQMLPTALTQVVEQVVHIVFSVGLAAMLATKSIELGVAGSSVGTSVGALAALIVVVVMFNRYVNNGFATPGDNVRSPYTYKDLAKTVLKYSIPITICSAVQYGGNLIDAWNTKGRLMVSGLIESDASIWYGYLNKSQQLINVPVSLVTALTVAMMPAIAAAVAIKQRKNAEEKINYGFRLCYMVAVPCAFGLMALHGGIFQVLKYGSGSELLLYGALTLIFLATTQIQTSVLQSLNRLYYAVFSLAVGIVVKIGINYFLIAMPSIRVYGALIGTYVSMAAVIVINQYIIQKKEGLQIHLGKMLWKPVAASVYMTAVVAIIYYLPNRLAPGVFSGYIANLILLVAAVLVGVFVYFVVMANIKGITKGDITSISRKIYDLLPGFMKNMLVEEEECEEE